ncbi:hypothetical protein MBLNU13_g05228t1 [Cladosporium sp. NU13]
MSATPSIPQNDRCSICDDPKPQGEPEIICYGSDICLECLKVIIIRVITDKDHYPVKLKRKTVFDYSDHLDASLLEQYRLKGVEYSTFPDERVFCFCGKFIGRLIIHREGEEYIAVKTCSDPLCQRFSCLNCATQLEGIPDIIDHGCKDIRQAKENDKQKMIESEERGTKFQFCPNCSRPIQLTEACHHIKCPCGTEFCYLCGKPASERSGHWREGRCPRYPAQPARVPPPHPMTEQDHRDIARGLGPMLSGFNERLLRIAEMGHHGAFINNQVREMWEALHDDMANVPEIPLPPRRPEPRTPSPPPRLEIPRGVSPRPFRQSFRFGHGNAPAGIPADRVRRLHGEEGMFNEAPGTMDMHIDGHLDLQRARELRDRLSAITGIPIPAQAANVTIDSDADAMSTPSPPRAPMFPLGRAPYLRRFRHFPPHGDDFFAHSAVFHPVPHSSNHFDPLGVARPPTHSAFSHAPPPSPIPQFSQPESYFNRPTNSFAAFARTAPHSRLQPPPPPMPTGRPQEPFERENEEIFARFPAPPRRWNDNGNA